MAESKARNGSIDSSGTRQEAQSCISKTTSRKKTSRKRWDPSNFSADFVAPEKVLEREIKAVESFLKAEVLSMISEGKLVKKRSEEAR
jgi:hypothetical protein